MGMRPDEPPIGVDGQGGLPLPWLGGPLTRARALDGAHALLVHGPAGGGHLEFGLLLAQAWLCERPSGAPQSAAGHPGAGCGHCGSCRLVRTRVHPDLMILLPDALRVRYGWVGEDESKLTKADAKPSRELRVDQVREAIDWAQRTSGRGRGKAMLLHPADMLNGAAANALLKTLEEPPGALRIVLTSADPERLLPTLRSRCQRVALPLPAADVASAWLRAQGLADPSPLLALAGGSPLDALAWAAEGLGPAQLAELPRRIAAGDASLLAGRPIPRVIDLLARLAHDAMAMAVGGAPRFYAAASLPAGADIAALGAWQKALLRTARHEDHPWNAGLLTESLVSQAAAAWPVAAPARPGRPARPDAPAGQGGQGGSRRA